MAYFTAEDGCRIFYEERGSGQPVILIHGWSGNRHFFRKQVPAFARKYRVLAYDLRGHGDSDRPETGLYMEQYARDLKGLIGSLNLKNVVLIGWSMGVQVIWEYIKEFGCCNLKKIVLADMTPKMMAEPGEDWPYAIWGGYSRADAMTYMERIARNWEKCAAGFVPAIFSDGPCREDIPWVLNQVLKNTPHVMINMWLAILQKDYRDLMGQIQVPCLYTYGRRKSMCSPEIADWLKVRIPDCSTAGFDGGHIQFLQDAENFNQVVFEFLGK